MAVLRPRRFKGPNSSRGLEVEKLNGNVVATIKQALPTYKNRPHLSAFAKYLLATKEAITELWISLPTIFRAELEEAH